MAGWGSVKSDFPLFRSRVPYVLEIPRPPSPTASLAVGPRNALV